MHIKCISAAYASILRSNTRALIKRMPLSAAPTSALGSGIILFAWSWMLKSPLVGVSKEGGGRKALITKRY